MQVVVRSRHRLAGLLRYVVTVSSHLVTCQTPKIDFFLKTFPAETIVDPQSVNKKNDWESFLTAHKPFWGNFQYVRVKKKCPLSTSVLITDVEINDDNIF